MQDDDDRASPAYTKIIVDLKLQPQCHAQDAGVRHTPRRGCDGAETPRSHSGTRIAEVRGVGRVESFTPELQVHAFGEGKLAEHAEIDVLHAGPAHRVASHVSEAGLGDGCEGALVSNHLPVVPTPPRMAACASTWSATWVLFGMFSDVPDAVTVNGRPV